LHYVFYFYTFSFQFSTRYASRITQYEIVDGETKTRYYCHYDAFSNVVAPSNIEEMII